VAVYGPTPRGTITEETPLNPRGAYSKSKAESDLLVEQTSSKGGFSCSILRPSIVFGSGMQNHSLLQMIAMIDKGLFFFVGKPGASANYVHIDNVLEALYRCGTMAEAKGRIFNLSDYCTIEEFVAVIARELGKPYHRLRLPETFCRWMAGIADLVPALPLTTTRVNTLTNRSFYSTRRIQEELAYTHIMPMEEGLRELIQSWKAS
jgi:nucleoside-diphosphate-sugar epimerase